MGHLLENKLFILRLYKHVVILLYYIFLIFAYNIKKSHTRDCCAYDMVSFKFPSRSFLTNVICTDLNNGVLRLALENVSILGILLTLNLCKLGKLKSFILMTN